MSRIEQIKAPIVEQMRQFEPHFRGVMKSKVPLLNIILNYMLRRKGKQMRPMLVFLTAKMLGTVNEKTFTAATFIELLHTATLAHDDVVDESYKRRGFWSINALWKKKIAVLVGDYFLSQGLLLAVRNKTYDLLEIVSEAVKEMSEGELLQIEKARKLDITEELYFTIIQKKTASLITSCCACGAQSVSPDAELVKRMGDFGRHAGIAFQIRDDMFDYEKNGITGKPSGNDLKEQKMTLPLIYVLNQVGPKVKKDIIRTIKKHHKKTSEISRIINLVREHGGLDYARVKMLEHKQKAQEILDAMPDNRARQSLSLLLDYIAERKK